MPCREYREVIIWQRWTFWAEGEDARRDAHRRGAGPLGTSDGDDALALLARRGPELLPFVGGLAAAGLTALGLRALRGRVGRELPGARGARALPGPSGAAPAED